MPRTCLAVVLACTLASCARPAEHAETPATPSAPDRLASCARLSSMDQAVIECALVAFLDDLQSRYPAQPDGTRPVPRVHVDTVIGPPPEFAAMLAKIAMPERTVDPAAVPAELQVSLARAAQEASARRKTGYAGFTSSDPRISVLAKPSWDDRGTTIGVSPPGYGFECDLAVVSFSVPIGAADMIHRTSVLARTESGWSVIDCRPDPRPWHTR